MRKRVLLKFYLLFKEKIKFLIVASFKVQLGPGSSSQLTNLRAVFVFVLLFSQGRGNYIISKRWTRDVHAGWDRGNILLNVN